MDTVVECEITSEPADIQKFCDLIENVLSNVKVKSEIIEEVVIATDEATTNIIMHSYENRRNEKIRLKLVIDSSNINVILFDRGRSVNMEDVKDADLSGTLEQRQVGGLGIFLMRKFMDKIDYTAGDKQKNEWNILDMKRTYK